MQGSGAQSAQTGSHAMNLAGHRTHLVKTDSDAMGLRWGLIMSQVGPALVFGSHGNTEGALHTPHTPTKPSPVIRTLLVNPPGDPTLQARLRAPVVEHSGPSENV